MKLEKINIRDFKRFADLEISNIPQSTKLIILTGPNGSGKTSLFEAFNYWMKLAVLNNWDYDSDYYLRSSNQPPAEKRQRIDEIELARETLSKINITFFNQEPFSKKNIDPYKKTFYIRSAYRHAPDFTVKGLRALSDILNDPQRSSKLILTEDRVEDNYQRLVGISLEMLYDQEKKDRKAGEIIDELIGEIRDVMQQVFNGLILDGPGNPLEGGTFRFTKGDASNFHYKNLSGGEKAAFDLILDFIVKRKKFNDTIFCIDEPELHMHTRLQGDLLKVLFDLIPENCQLWLSTHSIGMARMAAKLHEKHPGEVTFIDFHNQNFDQQVKLTPIQPHREFWKQMFHTALDDLSELVVPKYVVFCEGRRIGTSGKNPSFDASVYQRIFSQNNPDIEFIALGGGNEVQNDGTTFNYLLSNLAPGIKTWKILDRDDSNASEIESLEKENTYTLSRRDIESYLWDDEVLEELCKLYNNPDGLEGIKAKKKAEIESLSSRGKPADDIKAISSVLYQTCKKVLGMHSCGNNAESFALENLAPLIKPGMAVYKELSDVILKPIKNNITE